MQTEYELEALPFVRAEQPNENSIVVEFPDGSAYEYTSVSLGESNFAELVRSARPGGQLDFFMLRVLKGKYSRRLH
ncbi:hypothetical protein GLS40_06160 [Pseudooceanicola sp. 216_PA32_1]|uniref:KTSC domain-containing protein n=1 Tax=Pseudooceanicola pacificus TaxID=2676438 RepID=A0A844WD62_9RHOB|nr:hypothetical protein [Pseudooceanicola pacificus]MWB77600.1 hypothetical protein [Pseudooceanicola pacificus]